MPKPIIIIHEKWTNQLGDREDHFFLDKGRKNYLCAFNPKIISRRKINAMLDFITGKTNTLKKK